MGSCLQKQAPEPKASAVVPSWTSPTYEDDKVHLYGDVLCPYTQGVRLALRHKGVPVKAILVIPDDLRSGSFANISPDGRFPVFDDGTHKLSGSTDAILEYMEKTFTGSPLVPTVAESWVQNPPLPIVLMTMLQHRSILVHLERFVQLVDGLASVRPEEITKDSLKRTLVGTQLRGLPKKFGRLLELMQEHAQMEERFIFAALEMADPGLSASALKDHARDLPVMNGIREDIKGVVALKQGSSDHVEALSELATRLHTLQENTVEHYHEEEREQLPLLEAAGFGTKKQDGLVGQCLAVMETSHGHLLPYLLQGLRPHEIHQYLGILQHFSKQTNSQVLLRVSQILSNADEEFLGVWKVAQERVPALAT
ncbi:unnamed protein product [Sphagnum compactum]